MNNIPQNATLSCIITSHNYLHHSIITVLTAAGATDRFSYLHLLAHTWALPHLDNDGVNLLVE